MIADIGNVETEALLAKTEKEIGKVYARAAKETSEKLEAYLTRFEDQKQSMLDDVKNGKITKKQYQAWAQSKMLTGKRYKAMVDTLTEDCVNADKIAMSIVNGHTPEAYAINRNFSAFEIEKESGFDTNYTLYNRRTVEKLVSEDEILLPKPKVDIPKDKRWNKQHIRNEITQGVLQGESISKVAKRMRKVVGMDKSAAVRNARTAITGAQNAGRVDTYSEAAEKGINLKQIWIATLDNRTRHSHALMDGEMVDVGEEFSNGCRYPGDPSGEPEEVYNCRCTMRAHLTGFSFSDTPLERNSKFEGQTYEQWKQEHQKRR